MNTLQLYVLFFMMEINSRKNCSEIGRHIGISLPVKSDSCGGNDVYFRFRMDLDNYIVRK